MQSNAQPASANDDNYVAMPYSDDPKAPKRRSKRIADRNGRNVAVYERPRWETIERSLRDVQWDNIHQLVDAMLEYYYHSSHAAASQSPSSSSSSSSSNLTTASDIQFYSLSTYFDSIMEANRRRFMEETLERIVDLALQLPQLCPQSLPLLRKQSGGTLTITQVQAASLIANCFLCTFPGRASKHPRLPLPINFAGVYELDPSPAVRHAKLDCIVNYLTRVTTTAPAGDLTFERRVVRCPPDWATSATRVDGRALRVEQRAKIEDIGGGVVEVDFANKMVGGSVVRNDSAAQEEILFMIYPELLVSRLVTEELDDNECLVVSGCERFNDYTGYGGSFQWTGDVIDSRPRDNDGRISRQVVIVDAKPFDDYQSQLSAAAMRRELTKFYCGMVKPANGQRDVRGVATGHWGCGVFGGDKRLKAVIQMMAAAQAGRLPVVYCVFGDKELEKELLGLARTITKTRCTVKDLWNAVAEFADRMERFGPRGDDERGLYPFIERHCRAVARSNL